MLSRFDPLVLGRGKRRSLSIYLSVTNRVQFRFLGAAQQPAD
jgi:hypothetical protein